MSNFNSFFDNIGYSALLGVFGDAGVYQSVLGGGTISCEVVITEDVVLEPTAYDSNTVTNGTVLEALVSDVGDVAIGDTFVVGSTTYTCKKELENNGKVLKWVVHG